MEIRSAIEARGLKKADEEADCFCIVRRNGALVVADVPSGVNVFHVSPDFHGAVRPAGSAANSQNDTRNAPASTEGREATPLQLITSHRLPITRNKDYGVGRRCGVGRGLGVALGVGVGDTVGVEVGVAVAVAVGEVVGVGVGVGGGPDCAQYLPPLRNVLLELAPPQTTISVPVQTAA